MALCATVPCLLNTHIATWLSLLLVVYTEQDNVSILVNKTQELLDNVTIQQDIIFNATGIVRMVNSTTWETLAIRTPNIELAQMLARGINSTFLPTAEVTTIATAIANSSAVAQQTLQIAQNARYTLLVAY